MSRIKNKKLFVALSIFMFLSLNTAIIAELIPIRDVEIKIILEDPDPGVVLNNLFRVNNLDHVTGTTDLLHFFINASIVGKNYSHSWNISRSINKFTETGMGALNLTTGEYFICVNLIPLNFFDYNLSNNNHCKKIFTSDFIFQNNDTDSENEEDLEDSEQENPDSGEEDLEDSEQENPDSEEEDLEDSEQENPDSEEEENVTNNICDCNLQIISNKDIYAAGESVSFIIRDCSDTSSFEKPIVYWAEDLFGSVTKSVLTTSSKAPKSYTPRLSVAEKSFLIKAKIEGCNTTSKKLITFIGEITEKTPFLNISSVNNAVAGDIIILDLKGYKGTSSKTLLDIQLELEGKRKSETFKAYVMRQNQEFHIKLPFLIPHNLPSGLNDYFLVARGLDLEDSFKISIKSIIETQKEIKILNVYTRKQKFDGTLNVIISWEGEGEAQLRIISQNETLLINTSKNSLTVPLRINKHNEIIIVELLKNNKSKDVMLLELDLTFDEVTDSNTALTNNPSINDSTNSDTKLKKTEPEQENNTQTQEIESKAITETLTTQEKPAMESNLLTTKVVSVISENAKITGFVALAIFSLLFLFFKEIKGLFKKRTTNNNINLVTKNKKKSEQTS